MAFLINEDQALKDLLEGMTVADQNQAERPVSVYFRMPEAEERRVTYPFITIDFIDMEEEVDRAHRGTVTPEYLPEGYEEPVVDGVYKTEFPIPMSLIYQITTHARSAWHDRSLVAQMLNKLPVRFGSLDVAADETVRRLDRLDMQQVDMLDQNNKRVFRKAYTVAVSAEIFPEALLASQRVTQVIPTVYHQLEPFIVEPEVA
jgi:hypothetical protein